MASVFLRAPFWRIGVLLAAGLRRTRQPRSVMSIQAGKVQPGTSARLLAAFWLQTTLAVR